MCFTLFLKSSMLSFQGVLIHLSSSSHRKRHFNDLINYISSDVLGQKLRKWLIRYELSRQNKNGQIQLGLIISTLRD